MSEFYGQVEEPYFCMKHPTLWNKLINYIRLESNNEFVVEEFTVEEE